jgi:hypothetical protein
VIIPLTSTLNLARTPIYMPSRRLSAVGYTSGGGFPPGIEHDHDLRITYTTANRYGYAMEYVDDFLHAYILVTLVLA